MTLIGGEKWPEMSKKFFAKLNWESCDFDGSLQKFIQHTNLLTKIWPKQKVNVQVSHEETSLGSWKISRFVFLLISPRCLPLHCLDPMFFLIFKIALIRSCFPVVKCGLNTWILSLMCCIMVQHLKYKILRSTDKGWRFYGLLLQFFWLTLYNVYELLI